MVVISKSLDQVQYKERPDHCEAVPSVPSARQVAGVAGFVENSETFLNTSRLALCARRFGSVL